LRERPDYAEYCARVPRWLFPSWMFPIGLCEITSNVPRRTRRFHQSVHWRWYKDSPAIIGSSAGRVARLLFDTMDQQLFTLARRPAMLELLHVHAGDPNSAGMVATYAGYSTSIFMIGWAVGGVLFGILGRPHRPRENHADQHPQLFHLHRPERPFGRRVGFFGVPFLTAWAWERFAVGVALVAEVMPTRARPYALGFLQARRLSAMSRGADRNFSRTPASRGRHDYQPLAMDVHHRGTASATRPAHHAPPQGA